MFEKILPAALDRGSIGVVYLPMERHYIYLITNKCNGKKYIGQHVTRMDTEGEMLNDRYLGSGTLLRAAIKKYGRENFTKEILQISTTQREADEIECRMIDELGVLENRDEWYNRAAGGQYNRSEKHGELMAEIMKEVANRPEVKRKILEARVRQCGYKSIEEWKVEKEKQKLTGMRVYLINALKTRRNQMNREYLETKEGKDLQRKYKKACIADHLLRLNAYQKSPEGRKAMAEAVKDARAKKSLKSKYTPIQLDMLIRMKGLTTREAAKKIGVEATNLGHCRRGVQKMKGRWVPRYVKDEVFEAIRNA